MSQQNIRNQRGASLVEYSILVALIALIAISSLNYFGTKVACQFAKIERFSVGSGNWGKMVDIGPGDYRNCA